MKHLKLLTVMFFSLLLGTIPLMAQEDGTKCVMIETSQGETLEYYISSHPRLTQNNDKVTLTSDEGALEFSTVGIKKVYTSIATIKVVYTVDGEVYKTYYHHAGVNIKAEPAPEKEGYSFSGWDNEPTIMPDHDITIAGTFSINKYKLIYQVDGADYKSIDVEYGATITPEVEPTKEGYTFSGWSEIPTTMPAHDVTVTGTFSVNKYKLTYKVDNIDYKSYDVEYGATITPEEEPTKEGYTFSGWSEIPEIMPARDVTVTGTFTVNSGIDGVYSNADLVNTGNEIHINGLQPYEVVTIYSISGSKIMTEQASKDGKLTISTSSLMQSAYIIKTNSRTIKFTRK